MTIENKINMRIQTAFTTAAAALLLSSSFMGTLGQKCPILNCEDKDGVLDDRVSCFYAYPSADGKIKEIIIKDNCNRDNVKNPKFCNLKPKQFVWVDTDLQMKKLSQEDMKLYSNSQFYGKLTEGKCIGKADLLTARLNAGRKCLDPIVCNSRVCDGDTNTCDGKKAGDSCSGHEECDSDLACRLQTVWPFDTSCQPRGEAMSLCDTDYDCKMRNYCWQLGSAMDKVCLEMHSAPFGTQFFWDSVRFPQVNKESVIFHGKFCQSGLAMRRSATVAECVNVDSIAIADSTGKVSKADSPYQCTPDGLQKCQYLMKDGSLAFSLTCECAMRQNDNKNDIGYCPIPQQTLIVDYIKKIKKVWYQDNCHTLDRENLSAAIDCGVGNYDTKLSEAIEARFTFLYYPWVQDEGQKACIESALPESEFNIAV